MFGASEGLGLVAAQRIVFLAAARCLMRAKNVETIAEIPELESLSLGIFELQDFGVLETVHPP
jgi:hypothetical protein